MHQYSFSEDTPQQSVNVQKTEKGLYVCPKCGRDYPHRRSLWQHMKYVCGKEPQFQCPYCPKKVKVKGNLKPHILLVHGGMK